MIMLRNQKGIVLITAYMVILVLAVLSAAFFMRTFQEKRLSQQQNESMKAFYNAEKALSYAYLESANAGWTWFTHSWDTSQTPNRAVSNNLTSANAVRTQGLNADCHFITEGGDQGSYAANDTSFILKTFADPEVANVTVVRAKGISGNIERVLEYRISRQAIYDFAWWTPYDLNLNNVGSSVNGGRIHSGGNIYMYNSKRLSGVDFISTGKDKGIYYAWSTYYGPGYYDWYMDGSSNINGEVPIPHLGKADVSIPSAGTFRRWAGTTTSEAYGTQTPWLYQDANGFWRWRSYGSDYANTWPPRDWRNEESFFYGNSEARYNTTVGGKSLNSYNTWIYPAKRDTDGDIVFDVSGNVVLDPVGQIPAELEGSMWDWTKYNNYGTFAGKPQQALKFTVYDPATGTKKPLEDTRWKINSDKSVVMTTIDDPAGRTYWNMLTSYDYWKALGYSNADATTYSTHLNPEILDGTYGSEVPAGQTTIKVDNTNSLKQPEAWNNFLASSGLDDVVLANEKGEDMEAPRFGTTYKEKSKKAGLYLSKTAGTYILNYGSGEQATYTAHTCGQYNPNDSNAYAKWLDCVEQSIDVLVNTLNTDSGGNPLPASKQCAKKSKFINTYTNKWNVVLDLDLGKMDNAGVFPANGIIYSEVPIRLSNAKDLPSTGDPKKATFNLISEENIYLKGDYNNPASDVQWMPSAIISKKQISTLSNDFNDPQVPPAFVNYPNYPYVYVTKDASSNLIEADPKAGGGQWVYYGSFLSGSAQYTQALNLLYAINADWQRTFDKTDPSGNSLYTVSSSHPIINGQTWGAMPNRVQSNHAYNCLMASYYYGNQGTVSRDGQTVPQGSIPYGVNLERWINNAGFTRSKTMKGSYFQLDWGKEDDPNRFTAHQSDGPIDYYYNAAFDYRSTSRLAGSPYSGPYYLSSGPSTSTAYDSRFRNPLYSSNKPIFFGGGESSWREIFVSSF